jgi:hypothetical protein
MIGDLIVINLSSSAVLSSFLYASSLAEGAIESVIEFIAGVGKD